LGLKQVFARHYPANSLKHKAGVNEGGWMCASQFLAGLYATSLATAWTAAPLGIAANAASRCRITLSED
jgi:hypothetical protein